MLLSKAFSDTESFIEQKPLKLQFVTPTNNRQRKPYVCKAEPFNDMGNLNWRLEWKNNKKPTNYEAYEKIINKELRSKIDKNVESYTFPKNHRKHGFLFFRPKSKNKFDNIFRYYLSDVFVRMDLNTVV